MASTCQTPNGRENYVEFLNKFINVKIFGGCGEKCEKGQDGKDGFFKKRDHWLIISHNLRTFELTRSGAYMNE